MIKTTGLKEIQLSEASPGHLLCYQRQGEMRVVILVHGPQQQVPPAIGLITLTPGGSPGLQWLQPQALDLRVLNLGPFELVFAPKRLETLSSGSHNHAPGALIIESEGPALICRDVADGMNARFGISDWRLRTGPIQGSNFYIREWQLGLPAIDDTFDVIYTQKPPSA